MMNITSHRDIACLDGRLLLAFDALMRERSVTRAAIKVGLTQQGMSGQLKRMRGLFGDELFVREVGGVAPTPRADGLYPAIQHALSMLEIVVSVPSFEPAEYEGVVTIAASDYAMALLLPRLLRLIRERAPALQLIVKPVDSGTLEAKMRDEGIELALTVREFAPPRLPSHVLFKDRYVGLMRTDHPLARQLIDLDIFCSVPHLLVSPFRGDAVGPTDQALAAVGRKRSIGLVVPGFSVVGSLLEQTDLIAVLPERLLSVMNRNLIKFETPVPVPGFRLEAIWPARLDADPAHRWLREIVASASRMEDKHGLRTREQ